MRCYCTDTNQSIAKDRCRYNSVALACECCPWNGEFFAVGVAGFLSVPWVQWSAGGVRSRYPQVRTLTGKLVRLQDWFIVPCCLYIWLWYHSIFSRWVGGFGRSGWRDALQANQPTTSTQGQAEGISLHAALPAAYVSHAIGPDHGYRVARCRESPGAVDGEGPLQEGKVYQIIVAVLFWISFTRFWMIQDFNFRLSIIFVLYRFAFLIASLVLETIWLRHYTRLHSNGEIRNRERIRIIYNRNNTYIHTLYTS